MGGLVLLWAGQPGSENTGSLLLSTRPLTHEAILLLGNVHVIPLRIEMRLKASTRIPKRRLPIWFSLTQAWS